MKKYRLCILYLFDFIDQTHPQVKEEVSILYLISQKRSTDYVSFISLILLTGPTSKSKKKYQFCILYLKKEVPTMYLLSLWFYCQTHPQVKGEVSILYLIYLWFYCPDPPTSTGKDIFVGMHLSGVYIFFVSWWLFWVQYLALSASFVGASICVQWSDFEWFSIRGQSVQGQGSPDANHVHQIISYSLFASPFYLHFVQILTVFQL